MSPTSPLLDRVATAPISWGVCEVPGWGIQLPVETVLGEMAELGFTHTELGAIGFLPTDPIALVEVLERMGLQLLGGFVPVVLHDADRVEDSLGTARDSAWLLSTAGATFFVTAVVADTSDWHRLEPTIPEWKQLVQGVEEIERICADHDLVQVVHPHVDTLIQLEGNRTRTARELGISLRTLRNKIHEYQIVEPETLPRTGTAHAAAVRRRSGQISPSAA